MTRLPMTEAELQSAIVEAARVHGWLAYHTFDSRRSPGGFPDLVLARRGLVYAWELKGDDARGRRRAATIEQERWLVELAGDFGTGTVSPALIEPESLDAALAALKPHAPLLLDRRGIR